MEMELFQVYRGKDFSYRNLRQTSCPFPLFDATDFGKCVSLWWRIFVFVLVCCPFCFFRDVIVSSFLGPNHVAGNTYCQHLTDYDIQWLSRLYTEINLVGNILSPFLFRPIEEHYQFICQCI